MRIPRRRRRRFDDRALMIYPPAPRARVPARVSLSLEMKATLVLRRKETQNQSTKAIYIGFRLQ